MTRYSPFAHLTAEQVRAGNERILRALFPERFREPAATRKDTDEHGKRREMVKAG